MPAAQPSPTMPFLSDHAEHVGLGEWTHKINKQKYRVIILLHVKMIPILVYVYMIHNKQCNISKTINKKFSHPNSNDQHRTSNTKLEKKIKLANLHPQFHSHRIFNTFLIFKNKYSHSIVKQKLRLCSKGMCVYMCVPVPNVNVEKVNLV